MHVHTHMHMHTDFNLDLRSISIEGKGEDGGAHDLFLWVRFSEGLSLTPVSH